MKVREILRLVENDGWFIVATKGSHRQYKHASKPGRVTIAGQAGHDVEKNIREAIALHLDGLKEDGLPVPPHTATAEYVAV